MSIDDQATDGALPAEAVAALERGSKIEAIKITREARGIGLKESKETVEAYLASHPDVQAKLSQAAGAELPRLIWLIVVAVVVYLIVTRVF